MGYTTTPNRVRLILKTMDTTGCLLVTLSLTSLARHKVITPKDINYITWGGRRYGWSESPPNKTKKSVLLDKCYIVNALVLQSASRDEKHRYTNGGWGQGYWEKSLEPKGEGYKGHIRTVLNLVRKAKGCGNWDRVGLIIIAWPFYKWTMVMVPLWIFYKMMIVISSTGNGCTRMINLDVM